MADANVSKPEPIAERMQLIDGEWRTIKVYAPAPQPEETKEHTMHYQVSETAYQRYIRRENERFSPY